MSNFDFINPNQVDYHKFCIVLNDGTKVYKFVPECEGCAEEYFTDTLGNKLENLDLTNSEECSEVYQSCWKDKFIEGGLDNTFTHYLDTNQVYNVEFSDGSTDTFTIPSATGWSNQVDQITLNLGNIMPWAINVGSFCTIGCGGLPVPIVDVPNMKFRYSSFRVCPSDPIPVKVTYKSNQRAKLNLVISSVETKTFYYDKCNSCEGEAVWTPLNGGLPAPLCAIPCSDTFDEIPEPLCQFNITEACDNVNDTDSSNWVNVIRYIDSCDNSIKYYTPQVDSLQEYSLVGNLVDCDTGLEIPVAKKDPVSLDWIPFCVEGVQWYYAEVISFTDTGTLDQTCTFYKEGVDGLKTETRPIGTIQEGYCKTICGITSLSEFQDLTINGGEFSTLSTPVIVSGGGLTYTHAHNGNYILLNSGTTIDLEIDNFPSDPTELQLLYDIIYNTNGVVTLEFADGTIWKFDANFWTNPPFDPFAVGSLYFTNDVENAELNYLSIRTTGCNDKRRDDLLEEIKEELQDKCLTECIVGGGGGFDISTTLFQCSKVGFTLNNAFTSICPANWTPQELVDRLNAGNPTGTVFEVISGNVIGVVSGEVPELIQFFHSGGGSTTVRPSEGEAVCATRVKDCNSDKQTELLQTIADNTCPSSVSSNVVCSSTAQTVTLVDSNTVNLTAGQELLVGEVYDCNGNLQSFSISVLINSVLTEISDPVDTGSCPNPSETIPTGCVKDAKGQEWDSFQTVLNGVTITYYQDSITGVVGTPAGNTDEWTACGEAPCLTPDRHCFCVVSKGPVKGSVKGKEVKSKNESAGKILEACRVNFYNCNGEVVKTEYEINGKIIDEVTWEKYNFTIVPCDTPDITYTPGAVTCATVQVDHDNDTNTSDITLVLNCTVFTNDTDPTDTFTAYNLAADYTTEGVGTIGDPYEPSTTLTVVACAPGSIVEVEECYEALVDIKGVANVGDQINVVSVTNNIANTTFYTITHVSSNSIIYSGTDPVTDVNIDINDNSTWNGPIACGEPNAEPCPTFDFCEGLKTTCGGEEACTYSVNFLETLANIDITNIAGLALPNYPYDFQLTASRTQLQLDLSNILGIPASDIVFVIGRTSTIITITGSTTELTTATLANSNVYTFTKTDCVAVGDKETLNTNGCNDDRRDDLLQEIVDKPAVSSCSVDNLVTTTGNFQKGNIVSNGSVVINVPTTDKARNLNVMLEEGTCFSIDVVMNNGDTYTHATFGGSIGKEHQKCESYITQVTINELDGNSSRFICNWQSYNENLTD